MGILTRAQLMEQGGLAGGNDQSKAFVRTWLDAWLRRTAKSWAWPVLKFRMEDVAVAAGEASVQVGDVDLYIHRIFAPLFWRTPTYSSRGRILIRQIYDGDVDKDESNTLASNRLGKPTTCKLRTVNIDQFGGAFVIWLDPVPDTAILLSLDTHVIPNNLGPTTNGDAEVPWFPEDKTLIQACKCAVMEMDAGGQVSQAFNQEMERLDAMVIVDRDYNGEAPGDNIIMGLDPSCFR